MMLRMSCLGSGFLLRKFDVFVLNDLLKFCARLLRVGIYASAKVTAFGLPKHTDTRATMLARPAHTHNYHSMHAGQDDLRVNSAYEYQSVYACHDNNVLVVSPYGYQSIHRQMLRMRGAPRVPSAICRFHLPRATAAARMLLSPFFYIDMATGAHLASMNTQKMQNSRKLWSLLIACRVMHCFKIPLSMIKQSRDTHL